MSTTDTERPCDRYCTRECTLCRGRADLRELRTAADAAVRDTERDERLREARAVAAEVRRHEQTIPDDLSRVDRALLVIDAVVTAVRDEVARWNVEPVVTERDRERRALGVSILRALDGGID